MAAGGQQERGEHAHKVLGLRQLRNRRREDEGTAARGGDPLDHHSAGICEGGCDDASEVSAARDAVSSGVAFPAARC